VGGLSRKEEAMKRKIVISPGFGAGIASWASEKGYDVVECPEFVAYVEAGGKNPDQAQAICERAGVLDPGEYFYWGGLRDACVVEVEPPYRIDEYDGSESVTQASDSQNWRH
jgi:hypothetical protein